MLCTSIRVQPELWMMAVHSLLAALTMLLSIALCGGKKEAPTESAPKTAPAPSNKSEKAPSESNNNSEKKPTETADGAKSKSDTAPSKQATDKGNEKSEKSGAKGAPIKSALSSKKIPPETKSKKHAKISEENVEGHEGGKILPKTPMPDIAPDVPGDDDDDEPYVPPRPEQKF